MIGTWRHFSSYCNRFDASNLWAAQKSKGRFFDYEKLIKFIKEKFDSPQAKIFYYTAYPAEGTRNYSLDGRHKFYTFLKKGLGFIVRKKEIKRISIIYEQTIRSGKIKSRD